MPKELFVVNVVAGFGGSRSLFTDRDKALGYAEQTQTGTKVGYAEVRAYNTLDLINYALDDLTDAAEEDPEVENGELIATFE